MPVPFRDLLEDDAEAGVAAFLRILPDDNEGRYLGALFLINALGEPLEFTYNRIEIVQRFLWRHDRLRRLVARRLASSLFEICPRVPDLLFCLADEIEPELFRQELEVSIPVARLAGEAAIVGQVATEAREFLGHEEPVQLFWQSRQPEPGSPERALVERLAREASSSSPSSGHGLGCTRCTARGAEETRWMATAWWAERQSQTRSRAILPFLRRPETRVGSARRVELILPRVGFLETEQVEVALNGGLISSPLVSLCVPEVAGRFETVEAASCLSVTIRTVAGVGGTVALEGVVADKKSVWRARRDAGKPVVEPPVCHQKAPHDEAELPLAKRLAFLLQPPLERLVGPEGPIEWPHDLFPYQRDGIRALVGSTELLLADDMGLGKTVQVIAALRILLRLRRIEAALLVVPASLVTQWRREIRRWAPELKTSTIRGSAPERAWQWRAPAHAYLVSYETLRQDFTENPASAPRRRVWDVVVLDEAQRIKNPDAEVSRKCKRLPRRRSWALTGTPLENREEDLASICEFLTPWTEGEPLLRLAPGAELRRRHGSLQLRRKKEDVLTDLPPKTTVVIALQLNPAQRTSYERAEREGVMHLRELGRTVRITHVLELIQRLKQIANFCPETGESAKLDDLSGRLETLSHEGHRALVFSQYIDAVHGARAIASRLASFNPLVYTGDLSSTERDRVIEDFRSDPEHRALVLSLRAGGQGLNLQEASYVFHFDRWWNPAVERQAEDRSHRLGQTSPVTVYKYLCEGTIEERIDAVLRQKQALFDRLVDDVTIDLERHLTQDELFGLFGLEAPAPRVKRAPRAERVAGMSGEEFERYLADLLRRLEWEVDLTRRSRDGGVDLVATKVDVTGVEERLLIQCKSQAAPVGVEVVRELQGVLEGTSKGIVASPSGFTADATAFARAREIQLWDGDHLAKLAELGNRSRADGQ